MESPVVFLMGPTATGKSALALKLCDHYPMEIISVDSAQVYRGMDIGTAKPTKDVQMKYPHHLIDIIDPIDSYSAAQFRDEALSTIRIIRERGKIPLLVGGTMMYFKFLLQGSSDLPSANQKIRNQIKKEALLYGWKHLHQSLSRVDPSSSQRISPMDTQRIQRALEVYYLTGLPLSNLQKRKQQNVPEFKVIKFALIPYELNDLNKLITKRFSDMINLGLVDELKQLKKLFSLDRAMPSMKCVGYRQAWDYLEGQLSSEDLIKIGSTSTRQLAKRQMTWIKANDVYTINFNSEDLIKKTQEWLEHKSLFIKNSKN